MSDPQKGDPAGRRIAKNRSLILSEAGRTARALEVLLQRANFDTSQCVGLIKELAKQEQAELQKAHGRIESRRRFKPHAPHPLLEDRPRNLLFLDESGKSNPEPLLAGPRFFALAAIAIAEEDFDDYCVDADEIKRYFFKRTDLVFHEPYMRNREAPYSFGGNAARQAEFDAALDQLVRDTDFVAFGVGVRKTEFAKEFVDTGVDPYLPTDVYALAIVMLLERYIDFLSNAPKSRLGRVTFESQGPKEDATHQLEYARTLLDGSQWVPEGAFRSWLETGLRFTPKRGSHPVELADMLARDLHEWVRDGCQGTPKRWELFSDKIYCREDGQMGKFGVKIFPDTGIRENIEKHRKRCGAKAAEN